MKKKLFAVFIAAILIAACSGQTADTETPSATQASAKTPKPTRPVETASRIQVEEEALKGLEISVWHPWFGVEASLFESMVRDFNGSNEAIASECGGSPISACTNM
jgi:ABC-type glycerol-3-phosphate transport system substrate-binding protein